MQQSSTQLYFSNFSRDRISWCIILFHLIFLYYQDNNFILSKLVRKYEHQLAERDRFTFKQVQDDFEEKNNHLAKLIREAHEAKNKLHCNCPQTIESRVRHAKSKIRREKMLKF